MNIPTRSPQSNSGFSLIETIGVLAIISIVASMAVPSIVTRINRANSAKESKSLASLGKALKIQILRNKLIPDETTWAQSIADELGLPLEKVTRSVGHQPRVYLVDPAISIAGQTGVLPYTQNDSGSATQPHNVRVIIVSSQLQTLPAFLISGIAQSTEDFDKLWNTSRDEVPSGWPSEWAGHGEDLHIERLNLTSLFHRLVINDITEGTSAEIAVDASAPISIPAEGLSGYYFLGTEISLMNDGITASQEQLDRDLSFTYERGIWRGLLWEGKVKDATDFASALDDFRLSRITQQASQSSSQPLVIDAYFNYILAYAAWARAGFPSYAADHPIIVDVIGLVNAENQPPNDLDALIATLQLRQDPVPLYQALLDAQSQLALLTGNLTLY